MQLLTCYQHKFLLLSSALVVILVTFFCSCCNSFSNFLNHIVWHTQDVTSINYTSQVDNAIIDCFLEGQVKINFLE